MTKSLELAKLPKGVAAVYQNEWIQPVLCKVEKVEYDKMTINIMEIVILIP